MSQVNANDLSAEDKKILADAHANSQNPENPAHKDHPHVCQMREVVTAGTDTVAAW